MSNSEYNIGAWLVIVIFFLLSLFSIAGLFSLPGISITVDEVVHIYAGYNDLKTGKYINNAEHPPLVKDIAVLPLMLLNIDHIEGYSDYDKEKEFYQNNKINSETIVFLARTAVLTFNTFLLIVLTVQLNKIFGSRTSFFALVIFSISPLILGHAPLVANDFASAILQVISILFFGRIIQNLDRIYKRHLFYASLSLGLALSAKFSSILLFASCFLGGLFYLILKGKFNGKYIIKFFILYLGIFFIAICLVILLYLPHVTNHIGPNDIQNPIINSTVLLYNGILDVTNRMSNGIQEGIFLNEYYWDSSPGIFYYPITTIAKSPISLILYSIISLSLIINKKSLRVFMTEVSVTTKLSYITLMIFHITLYGGVSLFSKLAIGTRHFIVVYLIAIILFTIMINNQWKWLSRNKINLGIYALFVVQVILAIINFPNYISYYNILFGGYDKGYLVSSDSNFDWGQDAKLLSQWLATNQPYVTLYIDVFRSTEIFLEKYYSDYDVTYVWDTQELPPVDSLFIVSANRYIYYVYSSNSNSDVKQFLKTHDPIAKVGKTIFIYRI